MDIKTRYWASHVAFLQSTQAVLNSNRSIFEMRLAIVATVNRINKSMELMDGCGLDRRSRFGITNLDAALVRLTEMTDPAQDTAKTLA